MGVELGPATHTCPHAPQFCTVPVFVSQPSAGSPLQSAKPGLHAPRTHCPLLQTAVALGSDGQKAPSSTTPLQLSSRPLQTSALGWVFCWQTISPPTHAVVPAAQTPGTPVSQGTPPP